MDSTPERGRFDAGTPDEMVVTCRGCGGVDLFRQKDFPRKWAMAIVVAGMIASFWTYGISLLVVALIDGILFRRTRWMTVCYRCRAEYRGFRINPVHKEFDRHLDELYHS